MQNTKEHFKAIYISVMEKNQSPAHCLGNNSKRQEDCNRGRTHEILLGSWNWSQKPSSESNYWWKVHWRKKGGDAWEQPARSVMNCVRLVEYIRHAEGQIKMYTLQIRQCTAGVQCKRWRRTYMAFLPLVRELSSQLKKQTVPENS